MSPTNFRGYFINLDKNAGRLASMTRQLADAGLAGSYQRFMAVDGFALGPEYQTNLDRGNLGLWLTHERLAEAHRSSNDHLHILEDDALLPKDAAQCFAAALAQVERESPDWDLLFTEVFLHMDVGLFQILSESRQAFARTRTVGIAQLRGSMYGGTSSIFINRRSLDKYLTLIRGRWTHGMPIDLFLRTLIREGFVNAYVTVPFITSLSENTEKSDIRGELNVSHRVMNLYRKAAFKDANLAALKSELAGLSLNPELSEFAGIFVEVLRFYLSERHVNF